MIEINITKNLSKCSVYEDDFRIIVCHNLITVTIQLTTLSVVTVNLRLRLI